ncbi:MAG: FimB/Mfa2 family fimbrial subunit [Bacteroidales bacterium]|nr:FimB/Mfa2 family fimbrial subunit [Bacteroidales bacterium]
MKWGTFVAAVILALFSGCYDPIADHSEDGEDAGEAGSSNTTQLQVSLFTSASSVVYPAFLLVFDDNGDRIKDATLTEENPKAALTLHRGNYRLVALSGTSYYELPDKFNLESVVSVPGIGYSTAPLLMGQAEVSLSSATVNARLQMKMQTASVTMKIDNLPSNTQAVNVILSDIYTGISLRGAYSHSGSVSVPCYQKGNFWQTDELHLFPSASNNAVISVAYQTPDSSNYYAYNLTYPLSAGYAYQVQPSGAIGIGIDDSVIGTGPGFSASADTLWVNDIPTAPFLADGHVVAWIEDESDTHCDAYLISLNEWENVASAYSETNADQAETIAEAYREGGEQGEVSGWRIPTKDEAALLKTRYSADACIPLNNIMSKADGVTWGLTTDQGENIRYLCNDAQHTFTLGSAQSSITKAGSKTTYRLRLVKRVHILSNKSWKIATD